MVVKVHITGSKDVVKLISGIPRELNREISDGSGTFMKRVRKSAKLRAPKDTLRLRESIKLDKLKNGWLISVNSPHGVFQEEGFKPHWVHSDQIDSSNKLTRTGFFWVEKSTPFMRPALEHNISNLPSILDKSTKKAIQNAGR